MTNAKQKVLEHIQAIGVVPVLRASSSQLALTMATAISAGGVPVMEVTMTVPNAVEVIRTLVRSSPEVLVGAGTVLDEEQARRCVGEGAQFIVSPATDFATIRYCREAEVAVMPGALTPGEVIAAWNAGADVIKIFPVSSVGGPAYLKSLRAPLPHIPLLPSGGVTLATVGDYLAAGAWAVGAGSELVNERAVHDGAPEQLSTLAHKYREAVRHFRNTKQRQP